MNGARSTRKAECCIHGQGINQTMPKVAITTTLKLVHMGRVPYGTLYGTPVNGTRR